MQLIFASANKNKLTEIQALLPNEFNLLGLQDIGITDDIPEPGTTLKENSFLKAEYVLNFLKQKNKTIAVFADDSGLEVDALKGGPGVYSARYAGIPKNDNANNKKLLQELQLVTNRKARFVTIITLLINGQTYYFEGEIKGTVSCELRGTNGFGYDALFIPQGYRSTFAELSAEVKNAISHRAVAVNRLIDFLRLDLH